MGLAWINWGLGVVGSAVFVRFMVRKQKGVDYRLLVATAYLGLGTMWHSGLSASAPFLVLPRSTSWKKISELSDHRDHLPSIQFAVGAGGPRRLNHRRPPHAPPQRGTGRGRSRLDQGIHFRGTGKARNQWSLAPALRLENTPIIHLIVASSGIVWLVWYFGQNGRRDQPRRGQLCLPDDWGLFTGRRRLS